VCVCVVGVAPVRLQSKREGRRPPTTPFEWLTHTLTAFADRIGQPTNPAMFRISFPFSPARCQSLRQLRQHRTQNSELCLIGSSRVSSFFVTFLVFLPSPVFDSLHDKLERIQNYYFFEWKKWCR
jgi:hypothetical protein